MRVKKRRKRIWNKSHSIILGVLVAIMGIGAGLLFTPIFNIEYAWCEGNVRISQEEIMTTADIKLGKNIFTQSISDIKKKVGDIPLVEQVNARRVFPNKIKVWVRERIPAAYICTDGKCVIADIEGKVLEIIDDERALLLKEAYAPQKVEKPKDENAEETPQEPKEETETQEVVLPERDYPIPIVVGLELIKPEVSKTIDSKERDKLKKVMETFKYMEEAGLLVRATYLDVNDINDVTLMIENRLEVKMGKLDNIEYRSHFLAKVVNEKISATESAIMDYRGEDIYVRPPDDGKERMIPKTTENPDETGKNNKEKEAKKNSQ